MQVNADPTDSINRSLPLIIEAPDGQFVPALSLGAVMQYRGANGPVTVRPDGVQIGDRFVPTDEQHNMLLNFSSRLSDPGRVISMYDVLAGKVPDRKLAGKIVLVGAIDPTLGDNRVAPVNKATGVPGVLLHANAVNTMLTGTYLEPVSDAATLVWIAVLTALVGLARRHVAVVAVTDHRLPARARVLRVERDPLQQRAGAEPRVPARRDRVRVPRRGDPALLRRDASALGASPRSSRSTCPRKSRRSWSRRTLPRRLPRASGST